MEIKGERLIVKKSPNRGKHTFTEERPFTNHAGNWNLDVRISEF